MVGDILEVLYSDGYFEMSCIGVYFDVFRGVKSLSCPQLRCPQLIFSLLSSKLDRC